MKLKRPIMFVGTGSDVGKSIINAAFCRIFFQDGYAPAPFKAQNMSLNSFATPEGLEIGRAQAMQAEAASIPCHVDMNPVLLKPTGNMSSQVILKGKPIGNQSAKEYFNNLGREKLFDEAVQAYYRLAEKYNPIVIEGAGSISELNLKARDITNMRIALETKAAVILVADIDRGGVFGSVYGTIELLPPEERKLVKGILINKFRGDITLFAEGKQILEDLTGIPVVGIVPYYENIHIEDEDSVVMTLKNRKTSKDKINIAVIHLKHMSNFTDFYLLERIPEINLYYTDDAADLREADLIIIPGSKNTISDMRHLQNSGMARAILEAHKAGRGVYGICGGYQIMGQEIRDPYGVEGETEAIPGLGLLPVSTTLTIEKTTRQCTFTFLKDENLCQGYEIHMGETESKSPLCFIDGQREEGCLKDSKTWGTYIHGIFDNHMVIHYVLKQAGISKTLSIPDFKKFKEQQFNKLADHIRAHCHVDYIYQIMK